MYRHPYFASDNALIFYLLVLLLLSIVFAIFPELDVSLSGLFYSLKDGFFLKKNYFFEWVIWLEQGINRYVMAVFLALIVLKLATRWLENMPWKRLLFPLMVFLTGPVIIVNIILKNSWGRARPWEITDFDGNLIFTPAWQMADQCTFDCSFVSSMAASSISLLAVILVLPARWQKFCIPVVLLASLIVSFSGIFSGAYFLSDIMLGWAICLIVIVCLYKLFWAGEDIQSVDKGI